MTLPSRIMIKAAITYFLVGSLLGMLLLINKALSFEPALWALLPVHIEFMIFGWIIQFTMGVAYWILPRYLKGGARGNRVMPYVMIGAINSGIIIITLNELLDSYSFLYLTARILELLAVLIFIYLHWSRIVTYNK